MTDFWSGKKVLVTGHTGFVGSWLCCVLKEKGADVTGFSLKEEAGSLYGKINNELALHSFYGDLRSVHEVEGCVEACRPEIVFHLAAFGFVKECHTDPERAYSSNVQGTLNLLQVLGKCETVKKIVVASSDKVYRNTGRAAYLFTEEDCLGGMDTYSVSKTCEDLLAQSYYDSYLTNTLKSMCVVRPSNILGGGDHNRSRLIPGIYYNLGQGVRPEIRNPDSIRPWQNVLDMVDAYITLGEKSPGGLSIYNVGPEPDGIKTVREIADYVIRLYGEPRQETAAGPAAISGAKEKACLGLSIEKIKKEIGWKPERSLEETLDEIYEFTQTDNGCNAYSCCMRQIRRYYHKNNHKDNQEEQDDGLEK